MRRLLGLTAAGLLVLTGCGGGAGADASKPDTPLQAAYDDCTKDSKSASPDDEDLPELEDYMRVGDAGHSLTIESAEDGEVASMTSVIVLLCVLSAADAPDSVMSQVEQTNALMGRQTAEWGDLEMAYSYHPDSGVSAVLSDNG